MLDVNVFDDDFIDDDNNVFHSVYSNPPYQQVSKNSFNAVAVYPKMMIVAKQYARYITMVYPFKWVNSTRGKGLKDFRSHELQSIKYKKFIVFNDPSNAVFPKVLIRGGVNVFLWDKNKKEQNENNKNDLLYYEYNGYSEYRKNLLDNHQNIIINPLYRTIINKVSTIHHIIVSPRNYYHQSLEKPEYINKLIQEYAVVMEDHEADGKHVDNGGVRIFYVYRGGGIAHGIIDKKYSLKDSSGYKVFVSRVANAVNNNGTKTMHRPNHIFVAEPGDICSSSFLRIGDFDTFEEAKNCLLYLKTDFVGFLLGVLQLTQNSTRACYQFVPDVDFKTGEISDKPGYYLDFTLSPTLDEQLARIYDLTDDDVNIIQKNIRSWKNKNEIYTD